MFRNLNFMSIKLIFSFYFGILFSFYFGILYVHQWYALCKYQCATTSTVTNYDTVQMSCLTKVKNKN